MTQAQTRHHHPTCDTRAVRTLVPRLGTRVVVRRVRALIICAERRFPVHGGATYALCVAKRESGVWPWAINSYASSVGIYQVVPGTWKSWRHAYPRVRRWIRRATPNVSPLSERLVAYDNVMLSLRAMHDSESPWNGGRYSC